MAKPRRPFEDSSQSLLPRRRFLIRQARHGLLAAVFLGFSMAIGMVGYHAFADLGWLDAFLDASMILTGMGPVDRMATPAAKLFSGCYALYSGIAFLSAAGILFAPVVHRALHRFHLGR
jgi:hypothetical protein